MTENYISQPAVFFRREAYERAGGLDVKYHYMLDHLLWIRMAQESKIVYVPQTWAAARFHPQAKNRNLAVEFPKEAFRILDWAKDQPGLSATMSRVRRRSLASAHRVNARYLLDGGQSAASLAAWTRALFIHPATALARLNLFGSALLNILGLGNMREGILGLRKSQFENKK